jgi:hypothetical protein
MSVDANWLDDEKSAIVVAYGETWTWNENLAALRKTFEMMESVDHTVHTILDHTHVVKAPRQSIVKIPEMASLPQSQNQGLTIIVGAAGIWHNVAEIFAKVFRMELHYVDTREEAEALIRAYPSP